MADHPDVEAIRRETPKPPSGCCWTHYLAGGVCDGSRACQAKIHIHGCFADAGICDEPDEYHGALDV